ncbi:MAG: sensor histidine kinase [Streptosporangiales bacterium]|nr:sensor histidine kinase [Streptosporangiales bacterium]
MRITRSLVGDTFLAVALAVVGVGITSTSDLWEMAPDRPTDAAGLALVGATALVLAVRRRWPLATLAVAATLTSAYLVVGYVYGPIMVSFLVAAYSAARHRPLASAVPVSLAALALLLTHLFTNSAALPGFFGVIPASAWVVVPFAIGVTVRLSRESAARAREEAMRQRADDERLRVAQEVHDIVGHGLAAIKMQADVALHVLPKKPEQAEVALDTISRTSSQALGELRATLAVVRRTGTEATQSTAPSLERLEELRQRMGEAGLQVNLEAAGDPRTLPAVVDLTGYRIVQESLTNVLRHSGADRATVSVRYEPDAVVIAVANPVERAERVPGRGGGPGGELDGGLGIPGMRRRVLALGGEFSAGPTADGRFEVHARLPTGGHT